MFRVVIEGNTPLCMHCNTELGRRAPWSCDARQGIPCHLPASLAFLGIYLLDGADASSRHVGLPNGNMRFSSVAYSLDSAHRSRRRVGLHECKYSVMS